MPILTQPDSLGRRFSPDRRFQVTPAFSPALGGGSVSRPSFWCVLDTQTGAHWTHPTLGRVREDLATKAGA